MIIQNKVRIPHADTEYMITSHNTYHITDTLVFFLLGYMQLNCENNIYVTCDTC